MKKKPNKLSLLERSKAPEPFANASPERDLCQKCGAYANCQTPFMGDYVPPGWTGEVLLVGERPGQDEDGNSRRPFTGAAGKALAQMLNTAGYSLEDVALTNATRCADPNNAEPSMTQIRCCRPFLLETIRVLQPKVVLGAGTIAARALTNDGRESVTGLRGRVVQVPGITSLTSPPAPCPGLDAPGGDQGP